MLRVSSLDNARGDPQRLLIPHLPHLSVRVPSPSGLLDAAPEPDFSPCDLYSHQTRVGLLSAARQPLPFFDNQLHRFAALLPLRIIPLAYAHEPIPILSLQLLSTLLSGLQG